MKVKSDSCETEIPLIICSHQPAKHIKQIAELTSIANYRLVSQKSQTIHDFYFDAPVVLRLREINGTPWLTLKGPSQRTGWGGIKRQEIEVQWSEDGLTKIINELKERGIKLRSAGTLDYARPLKVLKRLGLKIIQDRENHRIVRNIVHKNDRKGRVLAELAIDSVVYHFLRQEVCLYELEIESKSKTGPSVVKTVAKALVAQFDSVLRPWQYGKLITGLAIEKLLNAGALRGLLTADNNLKPSAYDKIADCLSVWKRTRPGLII